MLRKICLLILTVITIPVLAQVGSGSIKGKLTDQSNGEPVPFANVVAKRNGTIVSGAQTDFDGNYFIKPLEPGKYDIEASFAGFQPKRISGVIVNSDRITFLEIKLATSAELKEVVIEGYKVPLIEKDGAASGGKITRDDIARMPGRTGQSIAQTIGGVSSAGTGDGGELSIRGARTGGSFIYIDGIKVRGSDNIPKAALQEVSVITGGVPANYGDVTGGVISYTTRGPSANYTGSFEAVTSGFKSGKGAKGLDAFGYNLIEGYLTGPIYSKIDADGIKKPIVGFSASLNYNSRVDGRPSIIGYNQITDTEREKLFNQSVYTPEGTSARYSYINLRSNQFENNKTSSNTGIKIVSGNVKFDVTTTPTINLTFGGSFNYDNRRSYDLANVLLNSDNNNRRINFDWRAYGKFTQRFKSSDESANTIKNVYYSVMIDYSKEQSTRMNDQHKKNFFDYGYIGNYKLYKDPEVYDTIPYPGGYYLRQADLPRDTMVEFTPGDKNPVLAKYVSDYFNLFGKGDTNYRSIDAINGGSGLRNGDAPTRIAALFNAPGAPYNLYNFVNNSQFRITATGSADVGNHAISAGFEYEQRDDREFGYRNLITDEQNRAQNVWAIARSMVNFHLKTRDTSGDSIVSKNSNGDDVISYPIKYVEDDQKTFDRNLRIALGMDPRGTEYINIDGLNPELLSNAMTYFSPDELLNDGRPLIQYYGYDTKGNKLKSKPAFEDFFTAKDENGDLIRGIGAFQPIYIAGYIMDKFAFDDINFNVGLRIDRYDANQKVLKDKFLLKEAYTVSEIKNGGLMDANVLAAIPGGMGDDYVVYVDDSQNAKQIIGYRNGTQFFNNKGEVATASAIKNSSGVASPFLKNPTSADNKELLEAGAFKDYTPQLNWMPRIAFSFPISDEAVFTAHYDILTRRPADGNRLDLVRYLYLNNVGSTPTNYLNNPALFPEKTIDYEVGFQQVISKSSSLKIQTFYREMRDQIQVYQNVGSYPQDYYSLDNLDFGTVKGLTIAYDMRKTNNITMRINYTLQFADGTGSAIGGTVNLNNTDFSTLRSISPLNFDQRHKINATVDYRYGVGSQYNGPMIGETKLFQGVGANFVIDLGSGTPYSKSSDPNNNRLLGTINGARMPWQFTTDLQIDKDIPVTFKKGDGDNKKTGNINVYVNINNLFNSLNQIKAYRFTGNADNDGFLADSRYQTKINNEINPAAYRDLYTLAKIDPSYYNPPRTVRLGVRLDF